MIKHILLSIALFLSLSSTAQKKDTTAVLSDTTVFLSVRSMDNAVNTLKDRISAKQYEDYILIFNQVIGIVAKEWEGKQKKK